MMTGFWGYYTFKSNIPVSQLIPCEKEACLIVLNVYLYGARVFQGHISYTLVFQT